MNTTYSTLCVYRFNSGSTWHLASQKCIAFEGKGSHMCRYEELQRACNYNVGFVPYGTAWLADRTANGMAIFVDSSGCIDFDGEANVGNSLNGTYCCMEWMKY
ncbi:MAG: hypothetical protein L6Q76_05465 [Polyangiaceae bacterium]|nr:hypothetical protein [Polyangiaceae bacterium]